MAYQNVGTPRFYINVLEWIYSDISPIYRTLPVNITWMLSTDVPFQYTSGMLNEKSFIALLGMNLAATPYFCTINNGFSEFDEIVNAEIASSPLQGIAPTYNGFSIASFNGTDIESVDPLVVGNLGSFVIGTYYQMPHSPELKLTITREMDGVKRIRTKGGVDLVNHKYTKPAMWGDAGAWELYMRTTVGSGTPENQEPSRIGRRVWDLSFSYLQDSDVFPDVGSLTNYETISPDGTTWTDTMSATDNTLLNEDTFYSQVIHKTNGGQLPFIFQPDSSNNNPDQFAICKFDMNSFQFKQVANGVYNMKLKIREVW